MSLEENILDQLLTGKNVLITGAGRNIGRSIAIEMARQGANIFLTDVDEERCEQVQNELREYEGRHKAFVADVSTRRATDRLLRELSAEGVAVDVLVNNVGVHAFQMHPNRSLLSRALGRLDPAKKAQNKLETWKEVYDTNVFGPVYLTNAIAETMARNEKGGSIIFITSVHQWVIHGDPAYSSSKAALGMIINELALDLWRHKIRVNGIAPGLVFEKEVPHPWGDKYRRTVRPENVGRAAVFLASDYFSEDITGSVIKVDAGLSLYNFMINMYKEE